MKKITFLSTAVAAVLLVGSPAAKAASLQLSAVAPLESFTFDIIGFNQNFTTGVTSGATYVAMGTGRFGLTSTVTGIDGQVVTMTSSETVGVTTTTDTFTISTPLNFLTDTNLNGVLINGLQFDLGDSNSGGDAVSLVLPITTYTATGGTTYGTANSGTLTAGLTPTTLLAGNGGSYAFAEGVNSNSNTQAINAYGFRTFTYSIGYPTIVPEPSTWAILGFGTIAGVMLIRRRSLTA